MKTVFSATGSAQVLRGRADRQGRRDFRPWAGVSQPVLPRDPLYKRALVAADVLASAAALAAIGRLTPTTAATLPLIVLLAQLSGLYNRDAQLLSKTTLEEAPSLSHVAMLYSLLIWLVAGGTAFRAFTAAALWGLLLSLMLMARAVGRLALHQISSTERCLVLGDARSAAALQRKFAVGVSTKATVVGRIPLDDSPIGSAAPPAGACDMSPLVLGTVDDLAAALIEHDIHRVIVVPRGPDDSLEVIRMLRGLRVRISVLPRMLEVVGSSFELDDVHGVALLGIRGSQLTRSARLVKRTIDLVFSSAALLALLPAFAVIASAIKLNSPGPVLYRQRRIGRDQLEFDVLKFRSMVDGADAQKGQLLHLNETDGLFKIANDPRTTAVGRFLRRTSLDELPQLWNVIRGEMSLVGPRPLVPTEDAKIVGWQRERLHITPGITGPWQILGSTRSPLDEMVTLDYLYSANWSIWLDVKLTLRTLTYMVNRRGA